MTRSGPSRLRTGILTAALLGTWLLGCAVHLKHPSEARAAIVGMNERRILSRLGPPDEFVFAGERRYFLYRLDLRRRAYRFGFPDLTKAAFCNVLFRIDRGVVSEVGVRGLNMGGLNADASCSIIADDLLRDYEYAVPPETAKAMAPPGE